MNCNARRRIYFARIAPLAGAETGQLESIYQAARRYPVRNPEIQKVAEAQTRLLFENIREFGIALPIHAAQELPSKQNQLGYAAVYDHLKEQGYFLRNAWRKVVANGPIIGDALAWLQDVFCQYGLMPDDIKPDILAVLLDPATSEQYASYWAFEAIPHASRLQAHIDVLGAEYQAERGKLLASLGYCETEPHDIDQVINLKLVELASAIWKLGDDGMSDLFHYHRGRWAHHLLWDKDKLPDKVAALDVVDRLRYVRASKKRAWPEIHDRIEHNGDEDGAQGEVLWYTPEQKTILLETVRQLEDFEQRTADSSNFTHSAIINGFRR